MIYVLHVRTGKETDIRGALRDDGYESLLPVEERLERRCGQWRRVRRTLIPGYVFLDMAGELSISDYYHIRNIPHVLKFLGGGRPQHLPPDEAEYILTLHNGGEPLQPSVITPSGITGPLGQPGVQIVKIDRRQLRAKAVFDILGKPTEITLSILTTP